MSHNKYCLLTNDVETTSIWFNRLRDETGFKVWKEGMPILLDIYDKFDIKSTFYVTAYIASLYPGIVKMIVERGHELGSHSWSHEKHHGLDVLDYKGQLDQLARSKTLLEDISGHEVISFRSPALRLNKYSAKAIIDSGYKTDSSVASQRFDMFMSFGSLKKLRWLFAPRLPYRVNEKNIFRKGSSPLIEIPLSATFFPYIGTTMRVFPGITFIQNHLLNLETKINKKPIVFDIHPNEFLDESGEEREISRRSNNPVSYFLQDFVRSKIKIKNLGEKAIPLYEKQIRFFEKRNYKFITVKDYCLETGLLKKDDE